MVMCEAPLVVAVVVNGAGATWFRLLRAMPVCWWRYMGNGKLNRVLDARCRGQRMKYAALILPQFRTKFAEIGVGVWLLGIGWEVGLRDPRQIASSSRRGAEQIARTEQAKPPLGQKPEHFT
jgi:hypothetical protein